MLKERFALYPQQNVPDTEHVVKNFGLTRWADKEVEDDEDLMADDSLGGFFDGHPDDHFNDMKRQFMEDLWTLK